MSEIKLPLFIKPSKEMVQLNYLTYGSSIILFCLPVIFYTQSNKKDFVLNFVIMVSVVLIPLSLFLFLIARSFKNLKFELNQDYFARHAVLPWGEKREEVSFLEAKRYNLRPVAKLGYCIVIEYRNGESRHFPFYFKGEEIEGMLEDHLSLLNIPRDLNI